MRLAADSGAEETMTALVDVSAGGIRVRGLEPAPYLQGTAVRVQIWPAEGSELIAPADVSLEGEGVVVRVQEGVANNQVDTALSFRGPLTLKEPFESLFLY